MIDIYSTTYSMVCMKSCKTPQATVQYDKNTKNDDKNTKVQSNLNLANKVQRNSSGTLHNDTTTKPRETVLALYITT